MVKNNVKKRRPPEKGAVNEKLLYIYFKYMLTARTFCGMRAGDALESKNIFARRAFCIYKRVFVFFAVFLTREERVYFEFYTQIAFVFRPAF